VAVDAILVYLIHTGLYVVSSVLDCVGRACSFFARDFHQAGLFDWWHDRRTAGSSPVCWQRCNALFPDFFHVILYSTSLHCETVLPVCHVKQKFAFFVLQCDCW